MLAPQLEAELADERLRQTVQDQVKQTLKRLLAGQLTYYRGSVAGIEFKRQNPATASDRGGCNISTGSGRSAPGSPLATTSCNLHWN